MRNAGIDIGSRTVKLVVIEDGRIIHSRKADSSYDPFSVCFDLIEAVDYDTIVATGYGRHMFRERFGSPVVSEIKAFASGSRALFPDCYAVLDIGGQDTKTISLDEDGRVLKFEMNDRCSAGTGRFLEIMASALSYSMSEFGEAALQAERAENITSMCTVFAESEVISLLTSGVGREEVALGIHKAITQRALSMLGRIPFLGGLVFAGGVAYNRCVRELLSDRLGISLLVPPEPQIVGALGAALESSEKSNDLPGQCSYLVA